MIFAVKLVVQQMKDHLTLRGQKMDEVLLAPKVAREPMYSAIFHNILPLVRSTWTGL